MISKWIATDSCAARASKHMTLGKRYRARILSTIQRFFLLMLAKCGVARQRLSFTILTFENDIIELQMASVLHHVASASGGCIHDVASDTRKNTNNGFSFFCSKSFSKSIVHQYFSKYFPQNRFSISLFQNRFFAE